MLSPWLSGRCRRRSELLLGVDFEGDFAGRLAAPFLADLGVDMSLLQVDWKCAAETAGVAFVRGVRVVAPSFWGESVPPLSL